jgi:hypothetical protein
MLDKSARTDEQTNERLLPLDVGAGRLGVSVWTLRAWVQHGKVKSNKLEIRRLIEASTVPARAEAA